MRLFPFAAAITIATLAAVTAPAAHAQDYPSKPIRLIVPFATGGVTDNSARVLADKLSKQLGQQVIVENKPGASGNVGTEQDAKSAPDGYTLLLGFDGTLSINPQVFPKVPFDTLKDFAPVSKLGDADLVLVAHPSVPANNFAELLAYGKANPGKLSFGHSGTGNTPHLAGEMLKQRTGLDMTHIPYKSGGQAVTDAVGGQVPLAYSSVAGAQAFIKSGRLKVIGVSSAKRIASLPEAPTLIEQGLTGFEVASWVGVLAPAATPKAVIDKLNREINIAMKDPELAQRYQTLGIEAKGSSAEEFGKFMAADLARWKKVVAEAKVKLD